MMLKSDYTLKTETVFILKIVKNITWNSATVPALGEILVHFLYNLAGKGKLLYSLKTKAKMGVTF